MTDATAADEVDPLREQLLDAAARVFARQGYAGTKIQDIVREAGLSTGAVYGRFKSKNDLLREAVVRRTATTARVGAEGVDRVADLITRLASLDANPLSDAEAVRLEAYVTARREPDVAAAIGEAQAHWRTAVQPLVDAARADGTVAADVDPEAVLYFLRTVHLGLLLQRGADAVAPDADAWNDLITRIVASFGAGENQEQRMTTTDLPDLPSRLEMDASIKVVTDHAPRIFCWNYDRSRDQLVTLYNKAMSSQWNSVTELDWSTEVDPEEVVRTSPQSSVIVDLAREAAQIEGSPLKAWGEKEYLQLGIESMKAQLSQFMHGEQGAMMVAAKIVETVPWIDARYYAATQTMDEARHTEVFAKYLHTKLGEAYPMSPFLEEQIDALISDSRWDIAYLGMQIVIESLALAAFGSMLRATEEPLLKKLLRYVMSDEARHVAFGVLSLAELYRDMSEAELKDRQDFLLENTLRSRARSTTPEIWERMGTTMDAVLPSLMEAAAKRDMSQFAGFQNAFFAKLVPNVRKLGLLDANDGHLRKGWETAGLLEFEFADDTGSDYETYDEVAKDRAERAAS